MADDTTTTTTDTGTTTTTAPTTDAPATDTATTFDAKYVGELRQEAAKHRTAVKAVRDEMDALKASLAKALGVGDDKTQDPAELQKAIAAKDAQLRSLTIEGKVRSLASKVGAEAEALLDSRSFLSALADLDTSAANFEADVTAAIQAAINANPKLKVGPAPATRGGAEINGGNNVSKTFSRAQLRDTAFYQENEKDILAAFKDGRITD